MIRGRFTVWGAVLSASAMMTLIAPAVHGQVRINVNGAIVVGGPDDATENDGENLVQPRADVDKDLTKALRKAEEFRDKGDFDTALEIVQRYVLDQKPNDDDRDVFGRSEDYFTDQSMTRSIKRQGLRLIADLPREGRRLYETKFGGVARGMLDEAIAARDPSQMADVARQYFHTQAGYEAAYLLGGYKLDQGEPLAAALYFSALRELPEAGRRWEPLLALKTAIAWYQAGEQDRGVEAAKALKKSLPDGRLTLGDRTIALFTNDEAAEGWLARLTGAAGGGGYPPATAEATGRRQWTLFRGDPAHNAASAPASPAWDSAWEFSTVRDPEALFPEDPKRLREIEEELHRLAEENRESGFLTLPAAHPLIIDDAVVFRTMRNVRAVHLATGELLWETVIVSRPYEQLVTSATAAAAERVSQESPLQTLLAQRAFRDLAAGTLSSDGRYLFALEGVGFLGPYRQNRRGPQHPLLPTDFNKLVAYELATDGKPAWEVGGSREYAPPLAGAFFLGPPLPLDGHLYALAEFGGDVRLVVLEAASGRFEWSQTLALPDAILLQYPVRRLAGLTPAYSNGVLVCPTTSGAVVAVDVTRRMLLWGYRYSRSVPGIPGDPQLAALMRGKGIVIDGGLDDEDRWLDSVPTIVDGRVLLTPRDSAELCCLNLVDGSLAWKRPRGQSLYLATVYGQQVVLVGRSQIEAVSLDSGEPLWDEPISIEPPSGRGFRNGRFYRLPLSTGEIVSVDLRAGRIVARSKSRTGEVFGNLTAAGGVIVSQSIDKIVGFRSLDDLRQETDGVLAKRPDDAKALALRGEMRLHDGREDSGLADLRRSIELKPTSRARELVVATLLEGLRFDFGKYRDLTPEVERLVEDPRQHGRFLRLYAEGLYGLGEHQAAFGEFLKLAGTDTGKPELERTDASLSVRSDRWVRPRIAEVYRKADGKDREAMDRRIAALLDKVAAPEADSNLLPQFLDAFVDLPIGDRAARLLADRLNSGKQALQRELLLRRLQRSEDRETAGYATAQLAALYIDRQRPRSAAFMLDELASRSGDVVCLDGKTGRELAEEWRSDEQVAKLLAQESPWPDRKIEVQKNARQGAVERFYPLKFVGPRGPLGENWTLVLDSRRQNVIARDGNGTEMWRLPTSRIEGNIPNVYGNYARMNGHLMILVFGTHFAVVDLLGQSENGSPVLWQRGLVEASGGAGGNVQVQFRQVIGPGGVRVMTISDRYGRPLGKVVPIDDSLICYQVGTRLIAADPLTGDTLWERDSMLRGSDVFGDREFVFVVPPNSNEAVTLRAADGEQIATRPLPAEGTLLQKQGRNVLVWSGRLLRLHDVWTGQNRWERRLPPGAQATLVEDDEVAVLNPHQGTLAIIDVADGRFLVDSQVEKDANVDAFLVHRSRECYVVLTHGPPPAVNGVQVVALNYDNPLIHGYAYGFDRRTGRKLWTTRIDEQAFDPEQPADLPVLVFTARTYRPFARAQVFNPNQFAVAVLDKRTGKLVFEEKGVQSLSPFEIKVDADRKRMQILFYRSVVELTMSDQPLPTAQKP